MRRQRFLTGPWWWARDHFTLVVDANSGAPVALRTGPANTPTFPTITGRTYSNDDGRFLGDSTWDRSANPPPGTAFVFRPASTTTDGVLLLLNSGMALVVRAGGGPLRLHTGPKGGALDAVKLPSTNSDFVRSRAVVRGTV